MRSRLFLAMGPSICLRLSVYGLKHDSQLQFILSHSPGNSRIWNIQNYGLSNGIIAKGGSLSRFPEDYVNPTTNFLMITKQLSKIIQLNPQLSGIWILSPLPPPQSTLRDVYQSLTSSFMTSCRRPWSAIFTSLALSSATWGNIESAVKRLLLFSISS